MCSSVTRGCRLFTVILVPSKGLRTGCHRQKNVTRSYQTTERYQRTAVLERQNSLRQTTRKAQRKPLWRVSYHSWAPLIMSPSPYATEWNLSCFPNIPGPFRPEPLHRMPLMFQDPPGSDAPSYSLLYYPSGMRCASICALAALCCTRHSALSAALFSHLLACGLSERGGYWILVCSFVKHRWQHLPHRGTEVLPLRTQQDAHCPPGSG